jgi:diguanylate cyclase (GGDEF)-like protein
MDSLRPLRAEGLSELEVAQEEESIRRVALAGGAAVLLVTAATVATLVVTSATEWWHYLLYSALAGVPLAYALSCNVVTHRMHVSLFGRYRAQLAMQLTGLQELVNRDELTGLHNRRHFYEVMQVEVQKAHASRQPLAILIMDLDGMKVINDEHGHQVGDVVLSNLGKVIARHTRTHDVAARLGGDEFGVVMPATDKRGAFALARRLWVDLEAAPMFADDKRELMVTVSIGLAGFPWGGESVEEMIQWADADMYANKVSRRVALESEAKEPAGAGRLLMEEQLSERGVARDY